MRPLRYPSRSHWTSAAYGVVYEKRADDAWYILVTPFAFPGHGLTLVEADGRFMKLATLAFYFIRPQLN